MTETAVIPRERTETVKERVGRIVTQWLTPFKLGVISLLSALLIGALSYLNQRGLRYLPETLRRIVVAFDNSATIELLSIAATILVVNVLYQRRDTEREKRRLILQMGSPDNAFALEAVRALRSYGWLSNGSLKEANLGKADLRNAFLVGVNLQEAFLGDANLQAADLRSARLQDAWLVGAKLQGADLRKACLQGADLRKACLQEAKLRSANLQDADLGGANLQGANLARVEYNNDTAWPEGFTPPPNAVNLDAETEQNSL